MAGAVPVLEVASLILARILPSTDLPDEGSQPSELGEQWPAAWRAHGCFPLVTPHLPPQLPFSALCLLSPTVLWAASVASLLNGWQ